MKKWKIILVVLLALMLPKLISAEVSSISGEFGAESKTVSVIKANSTAFFPFRHSDELAIYEIALSVRKEVRTVRIDIQKTMIGADTMLPVDLRNGSIYKVLIVKKVNINDSDMENAAIKFKIPNYWIRFHKISPETIRIGKLESKNWTDLRTAKTAEDKDYYYFLANVTNFSIYAIYGKKGIKGNYSENLPGINESSLQANETLQGNEAQIREEEAPTLLTGALPVYKNRESRENSGLEIKSLFIISAALFLLALISSFILHRFLLSSDKRLWRVRMKRKFRRFIGK